jgi:hypothetical protein
MPAREADMTGLDAIQLEVGIPLQMAMMSHCRFNS